MTYEYITDDELFEMRIAAQCLIDNIKYKNIDTQTVRLDKKTILQVSKNKQLTTVVSRFINHLNKKL